MNVKRCALKKIQMWPFSEVEIPIWQPFQNVSIKCKRESENFEIFQFKKYYGRTFIQVWMHLYRFGHNWIYELSQLIFRIIFELMDRFGKYKLAAIRGLVVHVLSSRLRRDLDTDIRLSLEVRRLRHSARDAKPEQVLS